jgi:hypothetical protein
VYWPLIGGFIAFVLLAVFLGWVLEPSAEGVVTERAVRAPAVSGAAGLGTALAVAGAIAIALGVLLPFASSDFHIADNSLAQGATGRMLPFLLGAGVVLAGVIAAHLLRSKAPLLAVVLGGATGLIAAIVDGNDNGLRTLTTITSGGQHGHLVASLGPAMWVAAAGGVLAIVGALIWSRADSR